MNLSVGIVGLPNVGKSTLFNALLKKQQALAANYPFATIEPNIGIVAVPDPRLQKLAEITKEEEKMSELPPIKPATVEFLDIAGLVKGASEGAGLGNKFLSHIREVRVICHVVRAFEDPDIIREGSVDPKSDYETIETELALADLQSLEKQRDSKQIKTDPQKLSAIKKLIEGINQGKAARDIQLTDEELDASLDLFLISSKPEVIVLNVSEEQYTKENIPQVIENYKKLLTSVIPVKTRITGSPIEVGDDPSTSSGQSNFVVICAKIESELAALSEEEQKLYLQDLGLEASGLERLIQKAYSTLGLISFLTSGEKEIRAWTIRQGMNAQMAAGEIHTDFIKKFIKAEVIGYDDFVTLGGWKKAREVGKGRLEGKEYVVIDGDVIEFKIGS